MIGDRPGADGSSFASVSGNHCLLDESVVQEECVYAAEPGADKTEYKVSNGVKVSGSNCSSVMQSTSPNGESKGDRP